MGNGECRTSNWENLNLKLKKVTLHFSPTTPRETVEMWPHSDTVLLTDHTLPHSSQIKKTQRMVNK